MCGNVGSVVGRSALSSKERARADEWQQLNGAGGGVPSSPGVSKEGSVTRLDNQFTSSQDDFSEFIVVDDAIDNNDNNNNNNNNNNNKQQSKSLRNEQSAPLLLKDLDVTARDGQVLRFGPSRRAHLIAQLTQDAYLLAAGELMDYSKHTSLSPIVCGY
jgi:hypothetical protein